ncbi:hypothetical protein Ddye_019486 [Dipteronia dyeriana]|uniref:IBH1-like N-terminal domain-containing protein n=1 Tax=Dipteronia dyeriana TaxID=168575 RepID=A0AAD9TY17_9ROSI|nr:hypothetical protein Ddye_019486 [Dipteronia dyeriana]
MSSSSSSVVLNHPVTNLDRSKRKKKKKSLQTKDDPTRNHIKWKSEAQQQIYSSKLIQALNQVTIGSTSSSSSTAAAADPSGSVSAPPSAPKRGRAVREAADRALAVAAKGRSRWSRAILTNRLKLKFRKQKRQKVPVPPPASSTSAITGSGRSRKQRFSVLKLKGKSLLTVQRKVRVLGHLVPGCRKQPLPVILEEATDYIAALEMQVRAMTALAELLSVGGGSSSSSAAAAAPPT